MADYALVQDGETVGFQSHPEPICTPQDTPDGTLLPLIRDMTAHDYDAVAHDGISYEVHDAYVSEVVLTRPLTFDERSALIAERRAAAYPKMGDQLDGILKALVVIGKEIALPRETVEVIAEWQAVKRNLRMPLNIPATDRQE